MVQKKHESAFDSLERELNPRWKIYIDTCSLYRTTEADSQFWDRFIPLLESTNTKFTVTAETFREFKKHKHKAGHRANESAVKLEAILSQFKKNEKDLMLVTDGDGSFNDRAIISTINRRAARFNQVYITNDLANAWDVYRTVRLGASVANHTKLLIYKIVGDGELAPVKELWFLPKLTQPELNEYFSLRKNKEYDKAERILEEKTGFRTQKPSAEGKRGPASVRSGQKDRGSDADNNGRLVSRNRGG